MVFLPIIIKDFLAHADLSKRNEKKKRPLGRPKPRGNRVGCCSVVEEHSQMGDSNWHNRPRGKGSGSVLKVKDILAVFVGLNDLCLHN